jgi:hypothetical protein
MEVYQPALDPAQRSDRLCRLCRGISDAKTRLNSLNDVDWYNGSYAHQKNLLALKRSADAGCPLCSLLFGAFKAQTEAASDDFDAALHTMQQLENGELRAVEGPTPAEYNRRVPASCMYLEDKEDDRNWAFRVFEHLSPTHDCGQIFLSRGFSSAAPWSPFRTLSASMSGRPSLDILPIEMHCSVEAYTTYGAVTFAYCRVTY